MWAVWFHHHQGRHRSDYQPLPALYRPPAAVGDGEERNSNLLSILADSRVKHDLHGQRSGRNEY